MNTDISRDNIITLARRACDTLMAKFEAPKLPPVGQFHYHQGVFLSGMCQVWKLTGDDRYFEYLRAWVDSCVRPDGNIVGFNPGQLDDLQPGVLLFPIYDKTGVERYRLAMDCVAHYMSTTAVNPEGGFWHKAWYRNQMWLDGLYMAGPFMTEYAVRFGRPDMLDQVVFQAKLMREKTRDENTGLWYHAWDYEKRQPWADPVTGRSPEFWGRSIGWVPVALLTECDLLPDGEAKSILSSIAVELLSALLPWQDETSGLWYQVVNKGDQPEDWLESSCTCLYAAALCMAVRQGFMEKDVLKPAFKAVKGIFERLGEDENGLLIGNVCVGTGVGDYPFYCARPTSTNDLHGVGAFLLMCAEASKAV
ncbi:MAG: glycoside hydrolase family 88 protein [Clostridiales bacterium]|nr:glycoside hydrolase family 88 protein [Clostridiales bacterium]